jgi:hypothetical protein
MSAPTLGATRWARAAAIGVATLALAMGAHVSAGGALPSLTVLAFLALPLGMGSVVMTGRRCGPGLLLGSMTAAQFALHHTLMAVTGPVSGMSAQMSFAPASALSDPALGDSAMAQVMATQAASGWSVSMTITHVVATVVAALLLARCEQAVWQLVSRLLPVLATEPILARWSSLPTPALFIVPALAHSEMSGGSGLRGPPSRLTVAA